MCVRLFLIDAGFFSLHLCQSLLLSPVFGSAGTNSRYVCVSVCLCVCLCVFLCVFLRVCLTRDPFVFLCVSFSLDGIWGGFGS